MKRILLPLFTVIALASCGGGVADRPPPWVSPSSLGLPPGGEISMGDSSGIVSSGGLQERTSALTQSFNLGQANLPSVVSPSGLVFHAIYKETQLPPAPIAPDSAFQFVDWWQVYNGGSGTITMPDGEGTGNLNLFAVQLNWHADTSIPTYGGYWVATIAVCTTDGAGHIYYRPFTGWTFWPLDHMQVYWNRSTVTIYSFNAQGVLTGNSTPLSLSFNTGAGLQWANSPQVTFTMNTSGAFGGCMHDVPNYDQTGVDLGDLQERNLVGINDIATTPAYLSSPTSNSKCSMHVIHEPDLNPSLDYDMVQWHVDGF